MSYKTFIGAVLLAGFSLLGGFATQVYALVPDVPTISTFSASPSTLAPGGYTTLTWKSTGTDSCTASNFNGWSGSKASLGVQSAVGPFNESMILTLTCVGGGESATKTITINVSDPASNPDAPTVILTANPNTLVKGGFTTLLWTSSNATSCTAAGSSEWSGSKATQGYQMIIGPYGGTSDTYVLSLTCTGAGGSKIASVNITYVPSGTQTPPSSPTPNPTPVDPGCVDLPVNLDIGSQGADVTKLQNFLLEKGYLNASATGYFGSLTQAAVIAFQRANGLSPVGVVGPLTRAKIQLMTCGTTSTPITPTTPSGPVDPGCVDLPVNLDIGSQGADVTKLQNFLLEKGYLNASATGYFGSLTQAAVIAFQRANGLSPVGVVGPLTRAKIQLITCGTTGTPNTPTTPSSPTALPTVNLMINGSNGPVTLSSGQNVVMTWTSQNATSCRVGAPINAPAAVSSNGGAGATFGPESPYYPGAAGLTYSVTCLNRVSTVTDSVIVKLSDTPTPQPTQPLPVDLKVNNSDGPITVNYGQSVTLSWSAPGATSCTLGVFGSDAAIPLAASGTLIYTSNGSYYPGNGATFRVACLNSTQSGNDSVTLTMLGRPESVTVDIKANGSDQAQTVTSGSPVSLTWAAQPNTSAYMTCVGSGSGIGASGIDASLWNSGKTYTGLMTARPLQTTTYIITCSDPYGSATDSVTVNVENTSGGPTIDLNVNGDQGPISASPGSIVYLDWTGSATTNVSVPCTTVSVPASAWSIARSLSGYDVPVYPTAPSTVYSITCTDSQGRTATDSITVNVSTSGGPSAPTVTLTASPTTIASGQSSTLTWTSTNATNCTASGSWSGTKTIAGTQPTGPLTASTNLFILTCSGTYGTSVASAQVALSGGAPTVTISASPMTVSTAQPATLTWSSTNATGCTAAGGWSGAKATSGTQSTGIMTAVSNTFSITCTNSTGGSAYAHVIVTLAQPTGNKFKIGDRVFVRVDVNARPNPSVSSTPASLHPIDDLGTVVGGPIVADGFTWWKIDYITGVDGWSVEDYLNFGGVSFTPVSKIFYFTASPTAITNGQSTTLSWYANATNCGVYLNASDQASIGGGYLPGVSNPADPGITSLVVSPASTWTYTLKCLKDFGTYTTGSPTVSQPITITVNDGPAPTISSFTITPSVITSGDTTTLTWSANANSCKILQETFQRGTIPAVSQVISSGNTSGTLSVTPKTLGTFTLVCERNRQTVSRSVAITADLPNDPVHNTTPSQATVSMNLKVNGGTGTNNIVSVVQGNDVVVSWDSAFSSSIPGGVATCSMGAGSQDLGGTMLNGSATLTKVHQFYPKSDRMMNLTMTCMGTDSTFKTFSATKDIMVKLIQQ